MTPAKLRAQRANAALSTGPRTPQGRRRSSLNGCSLPFSPVVLASLRRPGSDWAELKRLWQDVRAVFWFVERDCQFYLERATFCWWNKLEALRTSGPTDYISRTDADIERYLGETLRRFAKGNQRWQHWWAQEIGPVSIGQTALMRQAIEPRLAAYAARARRQKAASGNENFFKTNPANPNP